MSDHSPTSGRRRLRNRWDDAPPLRRLVAGVVTAAAGIVFITWPGASVPVIAKIIGVALLIIGILDIAVAVTTRQASGVSRFVGVGLGVVYLIAGIVCVLHTGLTIATLSLLVGLAWLVGGAVAIYRAATGTEARLITAIGGSAAILLGIIALAHPLSSIVGAVWLLGIGLVVLGAAAIVEGIRMRAQARRSSRPTSGV